MKIPGLPNLSTPKRLGHLPLIYDTLRRTGILSTIDSICGVDTRMKVSHGDYVAFILLGVFAGEHGLWRLIQRLDPYDLATVMDDDGIKVSEFHDVRLGRTLDAIYHAGPDKLYSAIALPVIESESLGLDTLHFDPTSLSFYGAYEEDLEDDWSPEIEEVLDESTIPEREPKLNDNPDGDGRDSPLVVHGYAKNRRMDLKQILYGLAVTSDGGIPLYGRAMNGNTSDVSVACEFLDYLRKHIPNPRTQCFVADCKAWSPGPLELVKKHQLRLLSRLPRSTGLAQEMVYSFVAETAPCLLQKYHAKRQRWSWIAYHGRDVDYSYHVREPVMDEAGKPSVNEKKQPITRKVEKVVPVRVVTCFSSELYRQKAETMKAVAKREKVRSIALIARVQRRNYACRADAESALEEVRKDQPFATCTITGAVQERSVPITRSKRGRPKKTDPKPTEKTVYSLVISAHPATSEECAARLRRDATYVLIRSRYADWDIADEQMIANYARQWKCESGFSWLKSQAAINPMYVQSHRRIESLCFLYTIALMVHTLIQRNVRRYLEKNKIGLPYHRDKPSDNITARFFYEIYRGVTTQVVEFNGKREKAIYGMEQWPNLGLKALGASDRAYKPVLERAGK
jgi:transposase